MLWAYFDESGLHDRGTGHLKRLSFGGCLASSERWNGFEGEWFVVRDHYVARLLTLLALLSSAYRLAKP